MEAAAAYRLPSERLAVLLDALERAGFEPWGPTVRDGAVVLDRLHGVADLPYGQRTVQDGGHYRLAATGDDRRFGCVHGADGWKRLVHPPRVRLWRCTRDDDGGLAFESDDHRPTRPLALVGVRGCDLAALHRLDDVVAKAAAPDPVHAARNEARFVVAVDCAEPAGTCFCASMGTGPQAESGFDWGLSELDDGDGHRFLVRAGSERGAALLAPLGLEPAATRDLDARAAQGAAAAAAMGRRLDTNGLREALVARRESGYFEQVAERCLGCANCTMVCPTCFCTTVEDTSDLAGVAAEHHRLWDSCFTLGFSYVNGGTVRESGAARYRQWLLHKLATWWDQFDACGCVGCGRCITWCPVGIDLTAEAAALRAEPVP